MKNRFADFLEGEWSRFCREDEEEDERLDAERLADVPHPAAEHLLREAAETVVMAERHAGPIPKRLADAIDDLRAVLGWGPR